MSNHLAIAAVTTTLQYVLANAMGADFTDISVTCSILPPDATELKDDTPGLNIFLYQVIPSAAWRSTDLPTRRSDGSLARRPRLGLDLYYLLTAYGKAEDDDPRSHRILGSAIRSLHTIPQLTRGTIANAINSLADPNHPLKDSDLAHQVELVKFSLVPLNLEELSKLWSVFFQTAYRLSTAYQASVVLIDAKTGPSPVLPVQERNVFVTPFQRPHIESVSPQAATVGETLVIQGQNLKGESVKVVLGKVSIEPDHDKIGNTKIEILLPEELQAGVNTVKVVHELEINQQTGLHKAAESNSAAFMLRPVFKNPPTVIGLSGTTVKSGKARLEFKPKVGKDQQVVLLLNTLPGAASAAYQFNAPSDNGITDPTIDETDVIEVSFTDVMEGEYLVRARVDGAETQLETDPVTGKYDSPKVTI